MYQLVRVIHALIIILVLTVPFSNRVHWLVQYTVVVPAVIVHWLFNSNHCMITYGERFLREQLSKEYEEKDCLTCRVIDPIFAVTGSGDPAFWYVFTTTLVCLAFSRVYCFARKRRIPLQRIYFPFLKR